jgi:hypothetical protein
MGTLRFMKTVGAIAALSALLTATAAPVHAGAPTSDERRIGHLEDVKAIEAVLVEYGRSLDARDFTAYSNLFAKDGEWKGGFGAFKGPAAIKEAMEKTFAKAAGDIPKGSNFHIMSNFIIDVQGDRATANSMFVFYKLEKNVPVPAVAGRYEDVLIRENGAWKFLTRNARNP